MKPRIEIISGKKLVGIRMTMTLSDNKTFELWRSFMPGRKEITNNIGNDLFSLQIYSTDYFTNFNPSKEFEKWAAMEVSDVANVPGEMESLILPAGMYAVFLHKGTASEGEKTFRYIFETWLTGSAYVLDNRPHFEILGEKYKNEHPDSEEEVWIPIKLKDL